MIASRIGTRNIASPSLTSYWKGIVLFQTALCSRHSQGSASNAYRSAQQSPLTVLPLVQSSFAVCCPNTFHPCRGYSSSLVNYQGTGDRPRRNDGHTVGNQPLQEVLERRQRVLQRALITGPRLCLEGSPVWKRGPGGGPALARLAPAHCRGREDGQASGCQPWSCNHCRPSSWRHCRAWCWPGSPLVVVGHRARAMKHQVRPATATRAAAQCIAIKHGRLHGCNGGLPLATASISVPIWWKVSALTSAQE